MYKLTKDTIYAFKNTCSPIIYFALYFLVIIVMLVLLSLSSSLVSEVLLSLPRQLLPLSLCLSIVGHKLDSLSMSLSLLSDDWMLLSFNTTLSANKLLLLLSIAISAVFLLILSFALRPLPRPLLPPTPLPQILRKLKLYHSVIHQVRVICI